ncbi:unnamed protein product (macronuclear) [Paramecium tetraurelia]|uniref:Protein kinase domain-containing protein n=1 Tax=Paramecium tetraurelia TaxID=5888 RepID=A0BI00_PARTE|nr:uncharacterized protein GSPATT00029203001 [Paramecium tetraurelia]CAK58167.1 unnamed protein product [Paramecium tetraurelia]|eukprot:XP_001425565.1 hypothetical protein (macronuclear) [Paramecium tetraurelia strain d4-2]
MSQEKFRRYKLNVFQVQKLKVKSEDRVIVNTSTNFKALSPQQSPKIKQIVNRTQLELERSKSSYRMENIIIQIKKNVSKNNISIPNTAKDFFKESPFSIVEKKQEINVQFLRQCKANNARACLQLLEPTIVHQVLNISPLIPINADLKANINCQDGNQNSALHIAVKNGNIQLVQALIYKQINLEIENSEKMTSLILASYHGNVELFQILINSGAQVNHQDIYGNTSLHYACKFNSKEIVAIILKLPNLIFKPNHDQRYPDYYVQDTEILQLFTQFQLEHSKQKQKTKEIKIQNIQMEDQCRSNQFQNNKCKLQNCPLHNLSPDTKQRVLQLSKNIKQEQKGIINTPSTIDSMKQSKKEEKVYPQQFRVLGLIGKGSFGKVYLVQKNKKYYAMKVLLKNMIFEQNICRYAITERNVLSVTSHPFIVKLRYAFQTGDKLFMILDYYPGGDLGMVLNKIKRFPEELVKLYACEIILALEDLHKRNIIFRDLKPDNILLDAEGHVLLTDFGLSKEGIPLSNQGAKSFCGSVAYLAPEMIKRQGHGKAVDWYLLGVVMYELLSGLPPYYTNDREALFYNIENASLKIPQFISIECRNLLRSLLERNPSRRLGSGQGDSMEIRGHPYFVDIDWERVLKRQLQMPKPDYSLKLRPIGEQNIFDLQSSVEFEQSNVNGWSYVQTE